jgi:hypothetical protein
MAHLAGWGDQAREEHEHEEDDEAEPAAQPQPDPYDPMAALAGFNDRAGRGTYGTTYPDYGQPSSSTPWGSESAPAQPQPDPYDPLSSFPGWGDRMSRDTGEATYRATYENYGQPSSSTRWGSGSGTAQPSQPTDDPTEFLAGWGDQTYEETSADPAPSSPVQAAPPSSSALPMDQGPPRTRVENALQNADGWVTQKQLSDSLNLKKSTVRDTLSRLVEQNLVEKLTQPNRKVSYRWIKEGDAPSSSSALPGEEGAHSRAGISNGSIRNLLQNAPGTWFTSRQVAGWFGIDQRTARSHLRILSDNGLAEVSQRGPDGWPIGTTK